MALGSADEPRLDIASKTMAAHGQSRRTAQQSKETPTRTRRTDKSLLTIPLPRRLRDKTHLRFVAKQPCLICGRQPSDPHHLRFAQSRGLAQKVSDEFTVPLCRSHHRELHRAAKEVDWWVRAGLEPTAIAHELWTQTHPLRVSASLSGDALPNLIAADTANTPLPTQTTKRSQLPGLPT